MVVGWFASQATGPYGKKVEVLKDEESLTQEDCYTPGTTLSVCLLILRAQTWPYATVEKV